MDVKTIFENNEKWIAEKLEVSPDYFKKLSKGQSPEFLYIGCSDSRVTAEDLMGIEPGEAFIHRNIANMVISIDLNVMSVLIYAVDHLKVNQIVVCGHYNCGGIKAAMQPLDLGFAHGRQPTTPAPTESRAAGFRRCWGRRARHPSETRTGFAACPTVAHDGRLMRGAA